MVGAAVLVATAILLIPEMLSGPRTMPPVPPDAKATSSDDAPIAAPADTSKLKTYTIDLSKSGPPAATAPEPKSEQAPTFAASTAEPTKGLNKEHVVTTPAPPAENRRIQTLDPRQRLRLRKSLQNQHLNQLDPRLHARRLARLLRTQWQLRAGQCKWAASAFAPLPIASPPI
jgi:hypothetical protein